jgi:uncharacterized protein YdaU (DUF1376 family)
VNFYKRYMGDFGRDTAHLTMLQRGAYNDLLDYYYASGKSLPADPAALYRIARAMTAAERAAVEKVADEFFPLNGDGTRHNKRADKEIAKHEQQAATNREIGKRGGRPRKTESLTESVSELEPNRNRIVTLTRNQIPERTKNLSPPDDGFIAFWEAWPKCFRKQSRGKCESVWRRKRLSEKAEEIIRHVKALRASEQWADPQFIPAPLVYLNEERWDGAETAQSTVKVDL